MKNKQGFAAIVVIVAVIAVIVAGFLVFNFSAPKNPGGGTAASPSGPASIQSVSMAKGIDAQGNPIGVATKFSSATDKQIYVVLALKNVTRTTTLAYARYFNGKFVDSKVIHPSTNGAAIAYFAFEKGVGGYPKGDYRIITYVNGKRSAQANYTFN